MVWCYTFPFIPGYCLLCWLVDFTGTSLGMSCSCAEPNKIMMEGNLWYRWYVRILAEGLNTQVKATILIRIQPHPWFVCLFDCLLFSSPHSYDHKPYYLLTFPQITGGCMVSPVLLSNFSSCLHTSFNATACFPAHLCVWLIPSDVHLSPVPNLLPYNHNRDK